MAASDRIARNRRLADRSTRRLVHQAAHTQRKLNKQFDTRFELSYKFLRRVLGF